MICINLFIEMESSAEIQIVLLLLRRMLIELFCALSGVQIESSDFAGAVLHQL
jgi:hypothetical protein